MQMLFSGVTVLFTRFIIISKKQVSFFITRLLKPYTKGTIGIISFFEGALCIVNLLLNKHNYFSLS